MFFLALTFVLPGCADDKYENADVEKINNQINLIIACVNGSMEKVVHYSEALDSVNYVSIKGDTPLNTAVANGNLEIVKFLVANGASLTLKDAYGMTALGLAKEKGHANIVEYLEAKKILTGTPH